MSITKEKIEELTSQFGKESKNTGSQKGQLIFGDALYFKRPEEVLSIDQVTQEKIIRSICIYLVYGYLDLAKTLLFNSSKNVFFRSRCNTIMYFNIFHILYLYFEFF